MVDAGRGPRRALLAAFTLLALQVAAPPALSYDPEAWLVWGRELTAGTLDVAVGPAIKPLPMVVDGVLVEAFGSDAAWHLWSLLTRAALLATLAAAARLVFVETRDRWLAAFAAASVIVTPSLLPGGLEGASEGLVLLGLLMAAMWCADGRYRAAVAVLAASGLLRPEALVLAVAVAGVAAVRGHRAGTGVGRPLAMMFVVLLVPLAWLGLQHLGGGTASGAARAATALRPGQPGLADWPMLAAAWLAVATVPWLVLLAAAVVASGRRVGSGGDTAQQSGSVRAPGALGDRLGASGWLALLAALWLATVVLLAGAGFSGEVRYLAPGAAAAAVAAIGWLGRAPASVGNRPLRLGLAATVAAGATALALIPAVAEQRDRAHAQRDLDQLLARTPAATSERCPTLAAPRFLRPAVAWRTARSLSSVQSPQLGGTACALQRDLVPRPGPSGVRRRLVARAGEWSWWDTAGAEEAAGRQKLGQPHYHGAR